VPRMVRSMSSGLSPARSIACWAAGTARSEVFQSSGAYHRPKFAKEALIFTGLAKLVMLKRLKNSDLNSSFLPSATVGCAAGADGVCVHTVDEHRVRQRSLAVDIEDRVAAPEVG
jgi:hypothetical protein